jgi:glycosyltransferase involved in cell wall biosynthesis
MPAEATERPRLLYLAFYYPPSRASGVFRAYATAEHFLAAGWDVTVMAAPHRFFTDVVKSYDDALEARVDPRITVERPEMDYFSWETDVRRFGRFRGTFPEAAKRWYLWKQRHVFPERYLAWSTNAVRRGLAINRRSRFDLTIATGNPFSSFAAAWALRKLARIPYIVDYRDSWTLDQFANADMFPADHPAWPWERRILRSAAHSVFVNDAMREWHAARYPFAADRMRVVLNGWDPEFFEPSQAHTEPDPDGGLAYGFIGTITGVQPIEEAVEAFRRLRATPGHERDALKIFGHLGFFVNSRATLSQELGLGEADEDAPVQYLGPVAKSSIGEAYAASDVLVFMTGGSKYVTTGKVFEYMATGKPILSIHESPCAAEDLLRDYPLWFRPRSLDPADIAEAAAAAGRAAREPDERRVKAARVYGERFTREQALIGLERDARAIVERKGRR